jgi:D-ornithine 4,5-aminomutase subunit alpha
MKPRTDDFQNRRKHLEKLSDQELKAYFFKLTNELVDPLMNLAYEYTTPAIERSVLMRMGFSSLEAKVFVDRLHELNLLKHGAGHVLYLYSNINKYSLRDSYHKFLEGIHIDLVMEVLKNETK